MSRSYQHFSASVFETCGGRMLNATPGLNVVQNSRRFRSLFGVSPTLCAIIWSLIGPALPDNALPSHLLWSLMFLKVYASESVHTSIAKVDEKTFRKWSWTFISLISELKVIHLSTRLEGDGVFLRNAGIKSYMSVDGTDVKIYEPRPFDSKWYSHKLKGPGLRYEVGVSIVSGNLVWAYGPFPCGRYPDVKIFRSNLKARLGNSELVVSDDGYPDEKCLRKADTCLDTNGVHSRIRARHETVNGRLKRFFELGHRFRHHLLRHSSCFMAVANLTQLVIEHGEPLFGL